MLCGMDGTIGRENGEDAEDGAFEEVQFDRELGWELVCVMSAANSEERLVGFDREKIRRDVV